MREYIYLITASTTVLLALLSLIIPTSNTSTRMIQLYCILMGAIEIVSSALTYLSINNHFLYNIMIWSELLILIKYYTNEAKNLSRHYVNILVIVYLILAMVYIFIESGHGMGTFSRFLECILIIGLSLNYYNQELKYPKAINILKDSNFWFTTGLLFYFGGILFINLVLKYYLVNDVQTYKFSWTLQNVLDIIKKSIIVYGFLCYRLAIKTQNNSEHQV